MILDWLEKSHDKQQSPKMLTDGEFESIEFQNEGLNTSSNVEPLPKTFKFAQKQQ